MTLLLKDFAEFALLLADAAREETLSPTELRTEDKNEGGAFDPVTAADRGAERAMRALIEGTYPDHGISGEEFGERKGEWRYVWSLDPIDGTRAYICGLPSWTTLIALVVEREPVLGLIDAPRLGERYLGYGESAVLIAPEGETPLRTSRCRSLAQARFTTTDPYLFKGEERDGFERLRTRARVTRFGQDAYGYARLAAGSIDLVVESGLQPYDLNALIPVVRGAGGVIGDWEGGSDFARGRLVAAATRELFEETVALLA